jgi:hypothetical protein
MAIRKSLGGTISAPTNTGEGTRCSVSMKLSTSRVASRNAAQSRWFLSVRANDALSGPRSPFTARILFYVESDGRHVTAINPDGKILWSREPFGDAHLEFYRTKTPRIVYIQRIDDAHNWMLKGKSGKYIGTRFNSSQSGILDVKTGDFTFMGQN